jgi:hypothetical protein
MRVNREGETPIDIARQRALKEILELIDPSPLPESQEI